MFERAADFDVTRDPNPHIAFGHGIHFCLGASLARMEGEIVLTALTKAVKTIELDGEPRLLLNNTLRGWASLPVKLVLS